MRTDYPSGGADVALVLSLPGPVRHQRLFRLALVASAALHLAAMLTGPAWPPSRVVEETVVPVDLAAIPSRDLPPIPGPVSEGPPPPAPPEIGPARVDPLRPPLDREAIRDKVSRKGLLGVLSRRGPAAPSLAGLGPQGATPRPPAKDAALRDARPKGDAGGPAPPPGAEGPGIGSGLRPASRASTALASRVFTTDAGLAGRITGGDGDRTRSEGAILKTIEQYRSGIKYAYDRELMTNPDLSGEITVSFVILSDGSVSSAAIRASTVRWPALEEAVLKRILHMRFPAAAGGPVQVLFPFRFLPEM